MAWIGHAHTHTFSLMAYIFLIRVSVACYYFCYSVNPSARGFKSLSVPYRAVVFLSVPLIFAVKFLNCRNFQSI
jgi:hypothetical protein